MKSRHSYYGDTETVFFSEEGNEVKIPGEVLGDLMQKSLEKGKSFRFCASGFSMSPFIKNGDILTIFPPGKAYPAFGDVAACLHPLRNRLIIHRLVGIPAGSSFVLKGDNLKEIDGVFTVTDIIGVVQGIERGGRKIYLGTGPEKRFIALLSRLGLLIPLMIPLRSCFRLFVRRSENDGS